MTLFHFHNYLVALLPRRVSHLPVFHVGDTQHTVDGRHGAGSLTERHGEDTLAQGCFECQLTIIAGEIGESVTIVLVELSTGFAVAVDTEKKGERVGAHLAGALCQIGQGNDGTRTLAQFCLPGVGDVL